jgi:N-hydroxyarylamine O-acetyltransferase
MELLDAYCARIGYAGARTPTLDTLRALQQLHAAAIPFDAIDVLLDRGISLAPGDIDAKLIEGRRGGYCFEQNQLFQRVLEALGFDVEPLIAQLRWQTGPEAEQRPRSHMVLRVTLDGERWLCDEGFGSCVPTAPIRFDSTAAQPTPHERLRLTPVGNEHLLEAELVNNATSEWHSVYMISPAPCRPGDYTMANYYTATFPQSHFRHDLIVARTTPDARYGLLRNRLTIRSPDGQSERRYLTADDLERVLREVFGLPVQPAWRPVLERAAATQWDETAQ